LCWHECFFALLQQQKTITMKKTLLLLNAIICLAISSSATVHTVTVADFSFTPSTLTAHIGDTIKWVWSSGTHTTTSTSVPPTASNWNSNINSGTTSFIYVPTVTGTYAYNCTIHPTLMTGSFTVSSPAGVSSQTTTPLFSMFPNPVQDQIHVQFSNHGLPASLTVTDVNGRQVFVNEYKAPGDELVNLEYLPNGTYVLVAKQGAAVNRQELVIAH
jgi:plastocyanin